MDGLPPWLKIENLIGNLNLNFSGWFKGAFQKVNSPKTTVNIGEVKQTVNQIIVVPDGIPKLPSGDTDAFARLRQPDTLLPSSLSEVLAIGSSDEDKQAINKRIDEAVALLKLNRLSESLNKLLTLLGEIRDKAHYSKELLRVYNNLGVIYNRPKPEGDYDKALEYFSAALEKDPSFAKAKMNQASTYINKGDDESLKKGLALIQALWSTQKTADVLQILLWGTYRVSGASAVTSLIESEKTEAENLIDSDESLLNLLSAVHLEMGKFDEALSYAEKAVSVSPDQPEFITMKARALAAKAQQNEISSDFDIVPRLTDYEGIVAALELFTQAEELAENQQKPYLLPDIRYGKSMCLIWLGRYDESKHSLRQLDTVTDLPEMLQHQVNVLHFATHLHNRDFETAYNTFVSDPAFSKIGYEEKRRVARILLINGAPEQAKLLLDSLAVEAEQRADVYYWFDLGTANVLLNNHQEAISASSRAKKLTEGADEELRKKALSHYNAVNFHYSQPENGENSETDRMVEGMFEFQKEFPDEKVMTPIQAIDGHGQLTPEIKDVLSSLQNRYEKIKETFKTQPIPSYWLEKTFNRAYSHEIALRSDPDFTIEFTAVDAETVSELKANLEGAGSFAFDYLALLDLAKMDFLGFLEKLGKPVYIHEKLFQKVQEELLQYEIPELRLLWNFLRKSKSIEFVREDSVADLKSERVDELFDDWLVQTIKFAKKTGATFVTDDFRLYRFLKFEDVKGTNITPMLSSWLGARVIDEKMYARAIGDLAERFYIFLSYTGEVLFEIVLEDKGKITPRSYHLVKEVFLPGSTIESFTSVFAKFIQLFWRTGSLPSEKVSWMRFMTNVFTKLIDDKFEPLRSVTPLSPEFLTIQNDLKPITSHLAVIWKIAIESGTKDDLIELEKIIDEVLTKDYLKKSKEFFKKLIINRIGELTPKA